VRGLDYYTKTVFEIAPQGETGAQVAIGGGGRYDNLIEQLGGRPTPAVGIATGIERLVLNLKRQETAVPDTPTPSVFVACLGNEAKEKAIELISQLRKAGISAVGTFGDRSLKAQLKQADASKARHALIVGQDEMKNKTVVLRNMSKGEQQTVPIDKVVSSLTKH
jgi:histidyl-tRNA synthetase